MSFSAIVAQIAVLANEVTGVMNVYTRKTAYNDQNQFDNLFLNPAKNKVIGFEIYKTDMDEEQDNYNSYKDTYTVLIHGFIGINEETDGSDSYTELEELIENMHNKFRRNRTVNGTAMNSEPPRITEIVPELRLGAWTWSADIEWMIEDRTIFTESIS